MDLRKKLEQKKKQEKERKEGTEDFLQFLEKAIKKTGLQDAEDFCERLSDITDEELLNELERINGVLRQIPINEREAFRTDNVVQNQFFFETANQIVPPMNERRRKLFTEMFADLQAELKQNEDSKRKQVENAEHPHQIAARSLFNALIYLHPFSDGNGRTARTVYFELSPRVEDKPLDNLRELLLGRPEPLDEYHDVINQSTLETLLDEHDVKWKSQDELILPVFKTRNPNHGFDENYLQFISAYDVMTESERDKYVTYKNNQAIIDENELPEDIKDKIGEHHEEVREEFVRKILKSSTYPEKWGEWVQDPLDRSFNIQKEE